jgi:hypothetical protein
MKTKKNKMGLAGFVAQMGVRRNVYSLLVVKPDGKRSPGRPRSRWLNNINMGFVKIGWDWLDWICLTRDRYKWGTHVNAVMKLRVP